MLNIIESLVKDRIDQAFKEMLTVELSKFNIQFLYTEKDVPQSGKGITKMFQDALDGGVFKVFSGANESSFFDSNTNLLYRTLHDLHHAEDYLNQVGGTTKKEDELKLNCKMALCAYDYTLEKFNEQSALLSFFYVYHDTVGQVDYYAERKEFVQDQTEHTENLIKTCKGVQALLKSCDLEIAREVYNSYLTHCGY